MVNKLQLDEKEIIKLYNSGLSSIKIAKKFEVSKSTILNKLKKNKVKMRTSKDFSNERRFNFTGEKNPMSKKENREKLSKLNSGKKLSEETKKKMSESHKGLKQSKGTIDKRVKKNTGKKRTNEFKIKISNINKGRKHTEKSKKHMSEGHKGIKHSEETKKKIKKSTLGKRVGEKSSNWKGGITLLTKRIRKCFSYRQWRSDVFERDDYICQKCGQKGKILNAHHIKQFNIILEENNIKTLEESIYCDELWNINNGITLCIECHKKTHKKE
jgi:hypothetical protein